ncbi:hypothetical protein EYF80_011259 [Liparis tanakae]|uniref:Uncharacterized protein n=1 Tax=Liparis tanakae TaxID=230148 RepID=A0A4Z2IKP6_9TELE|nr:hypothetical protein EYF80_011259 [Liparis tanakae]
MESCRRRRVIPPTSGLFVSQQSENPSECSAERLSVCPLRGDYTAGPLGCQLPFLQGGFQACYCSVICGATLKLVTDAAVTQEIHPDLLYRVLEKKQTPQQFSKPLPGGNH